MPKALTLEEKKLRGLERMQEVEEAKEAPTPSRSGDTRRRRNAFNGTETKLSVNKTIEGYHLHVFTDAGNRIQEALDSGYEFVRPDEVGGVGENVVSRNGDLGDRIRYLVNPRAEGSEQFGYLMKQRNEWYEEDQAALQMKNNAIDTAIRSGKVTGDNPAFYKPRDGIKMT